MHTTIERLRQSALQGLVDRVCHRCVICRAVPAIRAQRPGSRAIDLCEACHSHFPAANDPVVPHGGASMLTTRLCVGCGRLWPLCEGSLLHDRLAMRWRCADCAGRTPLFSRIVVPYRYAWPVDHLLHALKYRERRYLAPVLGALVGQQALVDSDPLPDVLLPVPMHPVRHQQRGFNHAIDLAYWCSRSTGVACLKDGAERVQDTRAMAGQSRAERELHIRGAFQVQPALADRRVAIVDDVLTTGATAGELARELYDSGAASVELWVVARTVDEEDVAVSSASVLASSSNNRR